MFPFFILTESFAVYARTEREFLDAGGDRNLWGERWQKINAGSRAQAMGMGWQLRNVPMWQGRKP